MSKPTTSRSQAMRQANLEKLAKLEQLKINPYPPTFKTSCDLATAKKSLGKNLSLAGRVVSYRRHGKLVFLDLQDETDRLQLFIFKNELDPTTWEVVKLLSSGDFVGAQGEMFTTKTGEISLRVQTLNLLSKAIRPLPDSWHGLKNKEERFRKRYLDLLLNPKSKTLLDARWKILRGIRQFLWQEGYSEVETPILQPLYGGTNAKPFTTHLNALDTDMYLRVAPELYLKRLIIGGYQRIFEIARNFRNEGMDQTHQPEFTMIEFYEAYADYHRMMDLAENLIKHLAKTVNGTLQLQVEDQTIDLSGSWPRLTIDEAVEQYLHLSWSKVSNPDLQTLLQKHNLQVPGTYTRDKALFVLYDHLVTPQLIQPTWVIDYPQDVSPLAKQHRSKPGRVERFEGYIGGKEIFDGWSEINSALEQRARFENEQKNLKAGDDEAQPLDEDFLEALEYGMPPLGGIGIGIDRLTMFLTNTWQIREVIAFPLLRRKNDSQS